MCGKRKAGNRIGKPAGSGLRSRYCTDAPITDSGLFSPGELRPIDSGNALKILPKYAL